MAGDAAGLPEGERGGTLPAHARQIMYAARGEIQRLTGRTLDDQYFTQQLLPDFMNEHPSATAEWDVVFDARGHFHEPHTGASCRWARSRCAGICARSLRTRA